MESQGTVEVVAIDLLDTRQADWLVNSPPKVREAINGGKKLDGFEVAREARGSSVERIEMNVYDLDRRSPASSPSYASLERGPYPPE